jgi:hypothetical protein
MGMGALIDLSTVATYSLGAMPLSILKQTTNKNMPILEIATYLDYKSQKDQNEATKITRIPTYTYYKRGAINIPECEYHKNIIV